MTLSRRFLAALLGLALVGPALAQDSERVNGPEPTPAERAMAAKKKKKKKKGYDYEKSKYKSRDFASDPEHSYKYNEKGDPILPKKKKDKKKKSAEPPEVSEPRACGLEESCGAPKSSPDAEAEGL